MIFIVYYSLTGNNLDIAEITYRLLSKKHSECVMLDVTQFDLFMLKDNDILILSIYTYDEGTIPDEACDLLEDILTNDLHNIKYSVIGSGDLFYGEDYFCKAVEKFDEALKRSGAYRMFHSIKVDLLAESEDIRQIKKLINYC